MFTPESVHMSVPAVRVNVDLTPLLSFLDGKIGTLTDISFHHVPLYPHLSGPMLRFRLPDGRVVRTQPTIEGFDCRWDDTDEVASIDNAVSEVLHLMWDAVDIAFQTELLPKFYVNAANTMAGAVALTAAFVRRDHR